VQKYGSLKHRALVDSTAVNVAKLEKFFGANVKGLVAVTSTLCLLFLFESRPCVNQKKDKYEYVIAESRFDKNLFYTMEGHVKGGTLEKLIEKLAHHNNFGNTRKQQKKKKKKRQDDLMTLGRGRIFQGILGLVPNVHNPRQTCRSPRGAIQSSYSCMFSFQFLFYFINL